MNNELNQAKKNYSDAKTRDMNSQHQNKTTGLEDEHDADEAYKNKAISEWNSSASIRDEFGNMNTYIAFRKAELRGRGRICGSAVVRRGDV